MLIGVVSLSLSLPLFKQSTQKMNSTHYEGIKTIQKQDFTLLGTVNKLCVIPMRGGQTPTMSIGFSFI